MLEIFLQQMNLFQLLLSMPLSVKTSKQVDSQLICSSSLFRTYNIGFCSKESSLSSKVQSANITYSPAQVVNLALYTERVQDYQLNLNYSMQNLPSFALFGLTNNIQIESSSVSAKVPQQLAQGSLVCLACDLNVSSSDFAFVASGQNVSGLVLAPASRLDINKSLIQLRLGGQNVGGLVLNGSKISVSLADCNISCYVGQGSSVSGSVAAFVSQVLLVVSAVRVCSNAPKFGQGVASQTGEMTETCDLCRDATYSYGLCLKDLEFGVVKNNQLECDLPFLFDGEGCACPEGFVLNGTSCADVLESVNQLMKSLELSNASVSTLRDKTEILGNQTELLKLEQDVLNSSIQNLFDLSNETQGSVASNFTLLQQHLLGNFSVTDSNLQANTRLLDLRLFNNISALNVGVQNLSSYSALLNSNFTQLNLTLADQQNKTAALTQELTQLNESVLAASQVIQQQQRQIEGLNQLVQCLNGEEYKNVIGQCYLVQGNDNTTCSQKMYLSTFDVAAVTSKVIDVSNFTDGYVFYSATVISNAFVDIYDNVYSSQATISPLFQTQSTFTNLKIQFGVQTLNSGSFVLPSAGTSAIINQMNIISKPGCQMTVNSGKQLNILGQSLSSTTINNLLVNLSFAPSSGNITLVDTISGSFQITGYQVLGEYNSSQTVAMISILVNAATVIANQINFRPSVYNVGNCSSYQFSVAFSTSLIIIDNFVVIIGSSSNFLLLGSIATDSSNINYYEFGGIVTLIYDASTININKVISDSYTHFSTGYVSVSGFLIGYGFSITNTITVNNVCIQQNITSISLLFFGFGLIGYSLGTVALQNAKVTFSVQGAKLFNFGIVGKMDYSVNSRFMVENLSASVSIGSSQGNYSGSIFGMVNGINCSIINANLYGSVNAQTVIGGFIGYSNRNVTIQNSTSSQTVSGSGSKVGGFIGGQDNNATIIDSVITHTSIKGDSQIGGLIGSCTSILQITNSKIEFVLITAKSQFGVVVGKILGGTLTVKSSTSSSNQINGDEQTSCTLSSMWSVAQC
ncbi:filamentous_hemagglutinin N-terminal domain-containing protein [Hexamita inflata]|uniref:Filamentous hemagglutinin N-terminal domain-containing protein n=1 Tax=Hexamita inflata TaxID=28002 RepID=A0AA86RPL4_9EUKA|nr:filamentous hemagglutinin N-terminal domain-containing protein [Hexamita inflata]